MRREKTKGPAHDGRGKVVKVYRTGKVAQILGCSGVTILNMIHRGEISAYRRPSANNRNHWLITEDELNRYRSTLVHN